MRKVLSWCKQKPVLLLNPDDQYNAFSKSIKIDSMINVVINFLGGWNNCDVEYHIVFISIEKDRGERNRDTVKNQIPFENQKKKFVFT
jgi:hypothetical protein